MNSEVLCLFDSFNGLPFFSFFLFFFLGGGGGVVKFGIDQYWDFFFLIDMT